MWKRASCRRCRKPCSRRRRTGTRPTPTSGGVLSALPACPSRRRRATSSPVGGRGPPGRHRGHQHDGLHPGVREPGALRVAGGRRDRLTLLRWYVLHVLLLPFVIFMAIPFWRVLKDGGISGPLKVRALRRRGRSVVLGVDEFSNILGWRAGRRQLLGSTVAHVEPRRCADQPTTTSNATSPPPPPLPSPSASTWLTSRRTATTEEVTTVHHRVDLRQPWLPATLDL